MLAASIRISVARRGQPQTPAFDTFGDLLDPLIRAGQTIIDPNRFVADHRLARDAAELSYLVLRVPFIAAGVLHAQTVTATVRREHQAFYRRVLRCGIAAEPRPYPTLIKPLSLMMVDYPAESATVLKRYPFFAQQLREREMFAETLGLIAS